jgi:hypothetical protein
LHNFVAAMLAIVARLPQLPIERVSSRLPASTASALRKRPVRGVTR